MFWLKLEPRCGAMPVVLMIDNPTDNVFKLAYVFEDAARQAEDAGLDSTRLWGLRDRISGAVPNVMAQQVENNQGGAPTKVGFPGFKAGSEPWEVVHTAFLFAQDQGKG